MCKNWFKKKEKSISLEDLYNKIRKSKDVYEDINNKCQILLEYKGSKNPLVKNTAETDIETAISVVKARLEGQALQSAAHIIFTYTPKVLFFTHQVGKTKTLWDVSVNVEEIIKKQETK